jgi:microcystin degradation protein MlrC
MLVQQESNSFAFRHASLRDFTIHRLDAAAAAVEGANSEFHGAMCEIAARGGTAVPILHAHALPGGVLAGDDFAALMQLVLDSLAGTGRLDALVLCLHGAMASDDEPSADAALAEAIAAATGVPIAISLDLHANCTPRLCAPATVVTGYKTNPHVDLAETGARAAALLCAALHGSFVPTRGISTRPMILPDESLRIERGVLGEVLDTVLADAPPSVVDVGVFPTQPWLDAPGIGFTALVTAHADAGAARAVAERIADEVWRRREEFVVDRLLPPVECVRRAHASGLRPAIVTESADAPTAGGSGDSPAMLHALAAAELPDDARVIATIVDAAAVAACHEAGVGWSIDVLVGASIDPRYHEPYRLQGEVERVGDGTYLLGGAGYLGLSATMGRFAVVRRGTLRLLVTERPSWSADPETWRHAGLDPFDADVLVIRSCTDYLATFPETGPSAMVADVPGPCTPRLSRLTFSIASPAPWPASGPALDGAATPERRGSP